MRATLSSSLLIALSLVASAAPAGSKLQSTNSLPFLQKEYDIALKACFTADDSLPETPEGQKKSEELWRSFDKKQTALFAAAVDLAKADPKSDEALAALEWVLAIPRSYYFPSGITAMELVTTHHAANPKVGKIAAWVGYHTPYQNDSQPADLAVRAAFALIEAIADKNPDRTARGQAMMARAWRAKAKGDAEAAQAERAFELVLKDYADCPRLMKEGMRTLGEEAQQELFAMRHLKIGMVAPDIEGEDLNGVKFKLSDYRGKVTLLVFWASWCGPCMRMVPQERTLVERMKDKPFVLVGVNADSDRTKAKQITINEGMTWRSFWNGPRGTPGPISRAWNVRSWPTVYLLDGKGVIRSDSFYTEELYQKGYPLIDQLIKEAPAEKIE